MLGKRELGMQTPWLARLFFAAVASFVLAGIITGTACTRWGKPGPVPPTILPLASIYVDAKLGSDTSGNGSQAKPYRTLTKAVTVLSHAKIVSPSGVTIVLASGDYVAANGEKFPIIIPTGVSIMGTNYNGGPSAGSFINGSGEDVVFENLAHAAPRSAYSTIDIVPPASVSMTNMYVGASKLQVPSNAQYASLDVIGALTGAAASFGAGVVVNVHNAGGILDAGGMLTCNSCQIKGGNFGIAALSVPLPTSSPSVAIPSIVLMRTAGDSTIGASGVDIVTDGSANVNVSGEAFERSRVAFEDSLRGITGVTTPGTLDFGGGAAGSSGGNDFIGAVATEIAVTRQLEFVSALDDTWNPGQQHANRNGQYLRKITFGPGTSGKNVVVLRGASGSQVVVGPAPIPTPSTSPSPTSSPT